MTAEYLPTTMVTLGSYRSPIQIIEDASEEIMLLWGLQQPTIHKQNSLVLQNSQVLPFDACGHHLTILQSPSSLGTPGVTGAVMWDSGIVLGKFLEHSVDLGLIELNGKKVVELGSGCGLVGFIAAILGAEVVLTDLPDRLRLLRKNLEANFSGSIRGSAKVNELTWGDELDDELTQPSPDYGKQNKYFLGCARLICVGFKSNIHQTSKTVAELGDATIINN